MNKTSILFVCTGNICRSPTAEGVMSKKVRERGWSEWISVDSAGTHGYHVGEAPDGRAQAHAARRGYDISASAAPRGGGRFRALRPCPGNGRWTPAIAAVAVPVAAWGQARPVHASRAPPPERQRARSVLRRRGRIRAGARLCRGCLRWLAGGRLRRGCRNSGTRQTPADALAAWGAAHKRKRPGIAGAFSIALLLQFLRVSTSISGPGSTGGRGRITRGGRGGST